jgi:tetratricopeptide (TPR) repeat protein
MLAIVSRVLRPLLLPRLSISRRWRLVVGTALFLTVAVLGIVTAWRFVWPAEQLAAAEEALGQHDFQEARSRLNRYLARRPGDPKGLLLAARAAWQSGAHADAERFIVEYERHAGLTDASRLEWALVGAHQGDLADTEVWLRSLATRKHPDTPAVLDALARGYQLACRWQDAQQTLNQLIEHDPIYAAPLIQRTAMRRRLGGPHEAEGAEKAFRLAVTLAPTSPAAHAALAGALSDRGFVREAAYHYQVALRLQPTDAAALIGLARALTDAAELADAERRLDELLAAHPEHPEGLVERGRLALRRGRAEEAEAFLARALGAAPWHREGHRLYLAVLRDLGRGEAVARCEARLAELTAEDAEGARLRLRVENAPDDVVNYWKLYQWCRRNGEHGDGFASLLDILRRDPRHGPAHEALADHFERAGQPRRALQHRNAAGGSGRTR